MRSAGRLPANRFAEIFVHRSIHLVKNFHIVPSYRLRSTMLHANLSFGTMVTRAAAIVHWSRHGTAAPHPVLK